VTVVCEVGPGAVRILHPGSGPTADPTLVEAVLDAGAEPLTLVDDRPVVTEALWRTVFESLLDGAGAAQLVHPSWWSPRRAATVADAARSVVHTVTTSPRHGLLHRGVVFVEIGRDFVAVGGQEGVKGTETRWAPVDDVADAVACRVGADCGAVHIDAPLGVPGAEMLGSLIARRLLSAGRTVRQLADHELCTAATRSARSRPAAMAPDRPVRRRRVPAATAATAAVVMTTIAVGAVVASRQIDTSATDLVEGRVAVRIPVDWSVQRITGGPGSARVQVVSPMDPSAILHITQSRVPTADLAATADTLRSAVEAQPPGVFVDFNPDDRRGGRPAVTYREVRTGHDIHWTVVMAGRLRISIGCQSPPGHADHVEAACEQAVRSAREIS
jgi:type VII secretion-associated protein (TIGR03931 family)